MSMYAQGSLPGPQDVWIESNTPVFMELILQEWRQT